jgi:hypothetical protein
VSARPRRPAPRYRVVAYELDHDRETIVMDATGTGFLAIVATIRDGEMTADLGNAGPQALQEHMAILIANELAP